MRIKNLMKVIIRHILLIPLMIVLVGFGNSESSFGSDEGRKTKITTEEKNASTDEKISDDSEKARTITVATFATNKPYAYVVESNENEEACVSQEVLDEWAEWGVTKDKEITFHCGGGYRAAAIYFIMKQLGWEKVRVYQGGSGQWNKYHLIDPVKYPIQVGDPRDDSFKIIGGNKII